MYTPAAIKNGIVDLALPICNPTSGPIATPTFMAPYRKLYASKRYSGFVKSDSNALDVGSKKERHQPFNAFIELPPPSLRLEEGVFSVKMINC